MAQITRRPEQVNHSGPQRFASKHGLGMFTRSSQYLVHKQRALPLTLGAARSPCGDTLTYGSVRQHVPVVTPGYLRAHPCKACRASRLPSFGVSQTLSDRVDLVKSLVSLPACEHVDLSGTVF